MEKVFNFWLVFPTFWFEEIYVKEFLLNFAALFLIYLNL
jgi:hypothetical protein